MHHSARGGHESGLADVVPLFFILYDSDDELDQLFVGSSAPH